MADKEFEYFKTFHEVTRAFLSALNLEKSLKILKFFFCHIGVLLSSVNSVRSCYLPEIRSVSIENGRENPYPLVALIRSLTFLKNSSIYGRSQLEITLPAIKKSSKH